MLILVVDDEAKILNFIKKGLEMERYGVDIANDGKEALEKALINNYDLIVMDFMLPLMDGIEVCKKLRQQKIYIPILLLTARDIDETWLAEQDAGVNDYLIKPFVFSDFLARIKTLLRRGKALKLA